MTEKPDEGIKPKKSWGGDPKLASSKIVPTIRLVSNAVATIGASAILLTLTHPSPRGGEMEEQGPHGISILLSPLTGLRQLLLALFLCGIVTGIIGGMLYLRR